MLQTVHSTDAFCPGSFAAPFVIEPQAWKKETHPDPPADLRTPPVIDLGLLYPEAIQASSDAFAWRDIHLVHLRHSLNQMEVPASDDHCLVLNVSAPLNLTARIGKGVFEGEVRAGEVAIIPAGTTWSYQSHGSHSCNTLLLFLRPLFVQSTAEEFDSSYREVPLTPQIGFQSKHIRHIAMSLLSELNEENVAGRLYADSLAVGLAMQMIRRYSSLRDVHVGTGGMAPHRLRKAVSLIDRHLITEQEGRVALRIVAKEVGISYFHFSRVLKQSMGMTPTRYIAARRIERAKDLMQDSALPISEVALRSGFSSQSHFTNSFRRLAGVTPRSFRRGM
jgi:AraC family transcriptional regulator